MVYEIVYLGRDNTIDLQLLVDGQPADLLNTTRMTLEIGDTLVDSDLSPSAFDWQQGNGKLVLKLGGENLTPGTYMATLTVYNETAPNGIVWGSFPVQVRA
jgi:hypothetical protein